MCTVSFVKSQNKIVITSNRDEKVFRPNAIAPQSYTINSKKVFFPKDPKAGGTWYAVSENGTIVVLLNGADEKHHTKPSYSRSRGLIVLDIVSADSAKDAWELIDLQDIEPFTLVVYQNQLLYQFRWNEIEKSIIKLDLNKPHIWSSSTLYSKEIRQERSDWFFEFMKSNSEITPDKLLNFHQHTKEENSQNGLVINRDNDMKTLSITQSVILNDEVILSHLDLQNQIKSSQIIHTI
ncbi:MAG: hypothetical protein ACI9XR_001608 [Flavobacterium sp.]|jgi:hypothetical protein